MSVDKKVGLVTPQFRFADYSDEHRLRHSVTAMAYPLLAPDVARKTLEVGVAMLPVVAIILTTRMAANYLIAALLCPN